MKQGTMRRAEVKFRFGGEITDYQLKTGSEYGQRQSFQCEKTHQAEGGRTVSGRAFLSRVFS